MKLNHEADIDEWQEAEQLTKVLQVNSDLVHAASEGPAQDHAGRPVEAHPLELRPALLAVAGHLAHPDLVADDLHGLGALSDTPATQDTDREYKHWKINWNNEMHENVD